MTGRMWLLLLWIIAGTALVVVHVAVLLSVWRADRPEARWRWLAILPPAAPVLAWMGGGRVVPIVWGVVVLIYVVLRLLEHVI